MNTVCLNMIVRNETPVLRRCLDSVLPHIHSWVILDTGSTDGTQDLVREHLAGLPGELFERPWTDFGTARTQALERVGGRADYILFMDADDRLQCPEGFTFPSLGADAYSLAFRLGPPGAAIAYRRPALAASRLPWRWRGVLHEYLDCPVPFRVELLEGPVVQASVAGFRGAAPDKYRKDARLLERALAQEPDNARYRFYLAQSCRDAGMLEAALAHYLRRADMGGWDEEVWAALFEAAGLMERLGHEEGAVVRAYLRAFAFRPVRAEPLCSLARFFRLRGEYHTALLFAARAMAMPRPADHLFLDEACYQWRALDEFAVASYWAGQLAPSREACERLLAGQDLPAVERPRVEANLAFARRLPCKVE